MTFTCNKKRHELQRFSIVNLSVVCVRRMLDGKEAAEENCTSYFEIYHDEDDIGVHEGNANPSTTITHVIDEPIVSSVATPLFIDICCPLE